MAREKDVLINVHSSGMDFIEESRIIRISLYHFVYCNDIINRFDYYCSAVEPIQSKADELVDYSTPRYHHVLGFELMPIYFPSFSGPFQTTTQYLNFSKLSSAGGALDLGAYSGLTSILFTELVGEGRRVIAVDADGINIVAINKNFNLYLKITGRDIDLVFGAVWIHNDGLSFSIEGNMGSSASEYLGSRGRSSLVNSCTLTKLADIHILKRIDFIKCDVEGAGAVIFKDNDFFERFKPRIIIETPVVQGNNTTRKCITDLEVRGYECNQIVQEGARFHLLNVTRSINLNIIFILSWSNHKIITALLNLSFIGYFSMVRDAYIL